MPHGPAIQIAEEILTFIKDAYSPPGGFQLREETLTESVLVSIKRNFANASTFKKPTSKQESKEGHDWEWLIQTRHGVGKFRVQAKKLYSDGTYGALNHSHRLTSPGITPAKYEAQIERLLNISHTIGAAPIYAFYNGDFGKFDSSANQSVLMGACCRRALQRLNKTTPDYSPLSITLADAHWVYRKMTFKPNGIPNVPSVGAINVAALPWECLIRCQNLRGSSAPSGGTSGDTANAPDTLRGDSTDIDGAARKPDDATPQQGIPNEGLEPAELSYMRKLAYALQTGEVPRNTTGFSLDEPTTLTKLKDVFEMQRYLELEGPTNQLERLFASIDPDLEDSEKPDFYVYIDLRNEMFLEPHIERQAAPIVSH